MQKTIIFGSISITLSIVFCLLAAEFLLRFLPYNEGLRAEAVTREHPVFRFQSNRTSSWSEDWNFRLSNRVHVNNDGFVNNVDYDRTKSSPLLAIVGDSYIEAVMVPYENTVQGWLTKKLAGKARIYSFAASGAGLSQYLIWIRYARDTYRPDLFLVSIIANDFAESLHKREHSPGFWRFDREADDRAVWRLTEYQPSLIRRMLRHSALAMYLTLNVKAQTILNFSVSNLSGQDRRWVGNVEAIAPAEQLDDFRWAADRFLELLPEYAGVATGRIVLSLDGFRPDMYGSAEDMSFARSSAWGQMRSYVLAKAAERGIATIDLDPLFRAKYARDGKRFDFPTNSHWNSIGHQVLGEALAGMPAFQETFGDGAKERHRPAAQ